MDLEAMMAAIGERRPENPRRIKATVSCTRDNDAPGHNGWEAALAVPTDWGGGGKAFDKSDPMLALWLAGLDEICRLDSALRGLDEERRARRDKKGEEES